LSSVFSDGNPDINDGQRETLRNAEHSNEAAGPQCGADCLDREAARISGRPDAAVEPGRTRIRATVEEKLNMQAVSIFPVLATAPGGQAIPFDPRTWSTVAAGDRIVVQEARRPQYVARVADVFPGEPCGGRLLVLDRGHRHIVPAAAVLRVVSQGAGE
jgi:hypothetical protein